MARNYTVKVPRELTDKGLLSFFRRWRWREDPAEEVVIDWSECEFLAPWALVLFTAYAMWLWEEHDTDVRIRLDPSSRTGRYAIQAGLYELLEAPRPAGTAGLIHPNTAPLTEIRTARDVTSFANRVIELLQIGDSELEGAVKYSIVELLRNVVQHSRSPSGGLAMAQYFPNTGLVEVAIADSGVGVLTTLRRKYPELGTHLGGLKFSLLPHVSGTFGMGAYSTMQNNAGLGLFFIKEIAVRASGGFFLGSGDSLVDLWGNAEGSPGKAYVLSRTEGWRGTFAVLQLRRENIADFDALLSRCRELAAQARKDSTEVDVDFIDQIPEGDDQVIVTVSEFEEDVEEAALVRERVVVPALGAGKLVILDFHGIRFATQSFVHALLYRVFRDQIQSWSMLSVARATNATREAIRVVAAYARAGESSVELGE
ncbi:MAG: DUF4325 domain-containing protein [Gemmatimonadota bacterium]